MLTAAPLGLALGTLVPHRDPIGAAEVIALFDAAAQAGFGSVEFRVAHHDWAVADGMTSEAFAALAGERGLGLGLAEVSDGWVTADRAAVLESSAHLVDVTARVGGTSILAVARQLPSWRDGVQGLRHLADLAGDRGLAVTLEWLPYAAVADLRTAARLLEDADRDNVGLCVDTWHWFRQPGGPDVATLRAVPAQRIHLLQLSDAPARPGPDLFTETLTARRLPGDGVIDLDEVLDVLGAQGAAPAVVSEVFSSALAALGPAESARRQHAAARAVLARPRKEPA
jgi:sugar phosphate isomerase/epimerase